MKKQIIGGILAGVAALTLTGCGNTRSYDVKTTGAQQVPGSGGLFRFCDRTMLIYVSIISGEGDNPEAFFRDGCVRNEQGVYLPAIDAPSATATPSSDVENEMNQQDNRDEG